MAKEKPQAVTKASYQLVLQKLHERHEPDDDELPASAANL